MQETCKKAGFSGLFLCGLLTIATATATITPSAAEPLSLEIAKAVSAWDQRTGTPIISFTMTETSKQRFAEFTAEHVGRTVDIRVDGKIVMSPMIREPIMGGAGQIAGRFTPDEAKALADRMSSGSAKMDVEASPD